MKTQKKIDKVSNTFSNNFIVEKLKKNLAYSNSRPSRAVPQRQLMTLKKTQHA
jgi:hypothetical protein